MKRKIIKQGHNTLTITLPVEWAKRFNLNAGGEIDVIDRDNGLFITAQKNGVIKKTEFEITKDMDIPIIWKYFMVVYREGYDEILIKFNPELKLENPYKYFTQHRLDAVYGRQQEKKNASETLQGFVNRFIGMEIIQHGKDFILVKEMGETSSKEFDNSLRRIFLIIQQMAEETLEAVKSGNPKTLQHIHDVDISLDKFHDYCIRVLNKTNYKEPKKTSLLFSTLYLLELLGDEFKNIAIHLLNDFPESKFKNIINLAEYVKKEIDLYYDLFYNFDKMIVAEISELDKQSYSTFPTIYKKANEDEKEIFHHLRMINRYINALVELRMEMEY